MVIARAVIDKNVKRGGTGTDSSKAGRHSFDISPDISVVVQGVGDVHLRAKAGSECFFLLG